MKSLIPILFFCILFPTVVRAEDQKPSVYDRVVKTKTLRCGYLMWEPYLMKDLKTGEMSGVTYDYINAVAARSGIKVDWSVDVTPDQIVPSLTTGKADMFCIPCSPVPEFEKQLDFIGGFGKLPYFVYTANDKKWDEATLKTARFTTVDGYIPMVETPKAFPDAKISSLPQTTSAGELYDQIKFGKTDAILNEHLSASLYMKNNPGVIRRFSDEPIVLKPMSFPAPKGDVKWKEFVNREFDTEKPENKKLLEDLMDKYDLSGDVLLLH